MSRSIFVVQFGKRLRATREERGISQLELAFAAKIHRSHISLIECGRRSIRLETVHALAHALGVQPGELMPTITLPARPRSPAWPH